MHPLKKITHTIAAHCELGVDNVRRSVRTLFGITGPFIIDVYDGFASKDQINLRGRVLKRNTLPEAFPHDSRFRNLRRMIRRWMTYEIPFAKLEATIDGVAHTFRCNDEGYFFVRFEGLDAPKTSTDWHSVELRLVKPRSDQHTSAQYLLPGTECEFGVISDIDDTVLVTGAARFWSMVKTTMLNNVHTRSVFDGAAELYTKLQSGRSGNAGNPIFYVTSSPWNLSVFISDIFDRCGIPRGPMFMKDWGMDAKKFIKSGHEEHKKAAIEEIMTTYHDLPFVLIGDSGQMDPEIYASILNRYEDRIATVLIRHVSTPLRGQELKELSKTLADTKARIVVCKTSKEMLDHVRELDLI